MTVFKKHTQNLKRSLLTNEQLAKGISNVLIKMRDLFAAFCDKIYNRLSPSRQKFSLIFFCLLTGGLSLYQVFNAFDNDYNQTIEDVSVKVTPRHFQEVGDHSEVERNIVTDPEYQRLNVFESYMDSLRNSKTGYVIYDSILQSRPGLMDSVQELHHLYESQLKKEK